ACIFSKFLLKISIKVILNTLEEIQPSWRAVSSPVFPDCGNAGAVVRRRGRTIAMSDNIKILKF
ncbi:MAG: hypothetical protein ACYT04_88825, partial [Nostoc sp.]